MPLTDLSLAHFDGPLPNEVRRFLREADLRIERFLEQGLIPAYVPCDFEGAYRTLRALADSGLARGSRFCEWGSGFGVVACLAAFLDYESCGIEIEADLVEESRRLAEDFALEAAFVRGSFVPRGAEGRVHAGGEYAWLTTDGDYAYEELGYEPDDMDVVFAYPWPDEEALTGELFDRYAGAGAILVTFHGGDDFRARRKIGKHSRRR